MAPIGFAIVGNYAPYKLRGIMMGNWMMLIGIGAILSNYISDTILSGNKMTDPLITNISYSYHFMLLSVSSIGMGVIMLVVLPYILRLIKRWSISAISKEDVETLAKAARLPSDKSSVEIDQVHAL
jgi:dipeptide/tripeptide permease